ncbi:MAG: amidohydrolase family protein, partial [Clostridia bacterium]|nr:amidohydrolase family protein [Clostridia bacterium]
LKFGATTVLPTISAAPISVMEEAVDAISKAKYSGKVKGNLPGAHLEGPYFSLKQCGAQNPDSITPPIEEDYTRIITKYGKDIARWSYAPEHDEGGKFSKYLVENGILSAAGHTDAKYEDVKIAIDNGMNLITHLYSATSTVTRNMGFRSLGVIESAFLRDELFVEIIADGKHLPYDLVKMIIKIKGADKVALITDSMAIAGTDVKEGVMNGIEYIVEEGVCRLKDRSAFAGSVATANKLITTLLNCGFDIVTAVKMLTETPAKIMGYDKGVLAENYDADVIAFDVTSSNEINVTNVFVMGENKI